LLYLPSLAFGHLAGESKGSLAQGVLRAGMQLEQIKQPFNIGSQSIYDSKHVNLGLELGGFLLGSNSAPIAEPQTERAESERRHEPKNPVWRDIVSADKYIGDHWWWVFPCCLLFPYVIGFLIGAATTPNVPSSGTRG
jgi:hypothetical protein